MKKIEKINRIKVDLLKLKPIKNQKAVYDSYNKYLQVFFKNDKPIKDYFQFVDCPICSSKNNLNLMKIDLFDYKKCIDCGSIYNSPQLKTKFLQKMYFEGEYENYVKNLTLQGDRIRENITEVRKFKQLESLFNEPGNILDVGCGSGTFLNIASQNNWNCTGVELSKTGLSIAQEKKINIFNKPFEECHFNEKFDCISFWGVLEHVTNPIVQIDKAISILNKNGVIIFEVPSSDSLLMQYVIENSFIPFRYIESARHLSFFSIKGIELICKNKNLKLEYIESNGLDLQTVLLSNFDDNVIENMKNFQQIIDKNLLSDHYRVFLRKN